MKKAAQKLLDLGPVALKQLGRSSGFWPMLGALIRRVRTQRDGQQRRLHLPDHRPEILAQHDVTAQGRDFRTQYNQLFLQFRLHKPP